MIVAALALASGSVPVEAVVASIRCDWRDAAAVQPLGRATATLLLRLHDGGVPVDGPGGDKGRTVTIKLGEGEDAAIDCRPELRLAAPVLPLAALRTGGVMRGWFVLARLGDGRVTAVTVKGGDDAQGFEMQAPAGAAKPADPALRP
jgi:hypothetical protein